MSPCSAFVRIKYFEISTEIIKEVSLMGNYHRPMSQDCYWNA